jgi:two-component system phosphate regulon sensor histidine kinase PhoR
MNPQSSRKSLVILGTTVLVGQAVVIALILAAAATAFILICTIAVLLMMAAFVAKAFQHLHRGEVDLDTRHQRLQDEIELLRARQDEQRIIYKSMSAAMIAMDAQQRILTMNPAAERLLNMPEAAAQGKPLRTVVQQPELNRFVLKALADAKSNSIDLTLLGEGGASIHATAEPLRDGGNGTVGLLLLMQDVTRLKRLEAMRSDFAANVSHELRTPITNIMGYVETLMDMSSGESSQNREFLQIIHRNAERLNCIIEDLLSLARLEQPDVRGTLRRETKAVRELIDAAVAQHESVRSNKNIDIEIDAPANLDVHVNAQLIEQALGNLLSNALKFSPPGTKIVMRARRAKTPVTDSVAGEVAGMARPLQADEMDSRGENKNESEAVEFSVVDQGPGIARDHLPRLFERFYRVDRARSREMGGTGLGLAIVKHIVLVHGGRVEVESELGKGSVFRIVLPA